MQWSSFWGAFVGAIVSILSIVGGFVLWDEIIKRKEQKEQRESAQANQKSPALQDILESHIEQYIVQNFTSLFPDWHIYNDSSIENTTKPIGVRYRTEAGEIDILCQDSENNYVVIELKRGKASDKVVAQIDRYIAIVERNLAQPGKKVRGLIIAKSFDRHLAYTLSRRQDIDFWVYEWQILFSRNLIQTELDKTLQEIEAESESL